MKKSNLVDTLVPRPRTLDGQPIVVADASGLVVLAIGVASNRIGADVQPTVEALTRFCAALLGGRKPVNVTPFAAPEPFGGMLRHFRVAARLSQEELADKAGLSAKAVSALERGARRRPYRATVEALAEALQLSPDESRAFAAARRA